MQTQNSSTLVVLPRTEEGQSYFYILQFFSFWEATVQSEASRNCKRNSLASKKITQFKYFQLSNNIL